MKTELVRNKIIVPRNLNPVIQPPVGDARRRLIATWLCSVVAFAAPCAARALSLNDIQFWAGNGTNQAAFVVHWSAPEFRNNSSVESPVANQTLVWGFRWNSTATAEDLLNALAATDSRLVPIISPPSMFGISVLGFAFDLNANGIVGIKNGTNVLTKSPTNGLITINYGSADLYQSLDAGDLYWAGWNGPTWELWSGRNIASNGTNAPERGFNRYWTPDDPEAPYSGAHGEWELVGAGIGGLTLTNALWVGFTVAAGGLDFLNPDAPGNIAYGLHKGAPKMPVPATLPVSPYATSIAAAQGPFGIAPYDDPNSVLGMPSTDYYDPLGNSPGDNSRFVKLIEAAYHLGTNQTTKLITTLSSGDSNSFIIAAFSQPIHDDLTHPYGIDFLVFGNSFYVANGTVNDEADMANLTIAGGTFFEPLKVSVSPGYTGLPGELADTPSTWPWYRYDNGPFADTAFPTHAYKWSRTHTNWSIERMDFTKPVNPALTNLIETSVPSLSAADAIDYYTGSGGGTGFDLRESGFNAVRYLKVEGIAPDYSDGEVDAFAAVRPTTLNDELLIAPANLTNAAAALRFHQPGAVSNLAAMVTFTSLTDIAQVRASAVNNADDRAGLPAGVLGATRITVLPALGSNSVNFAASVALAAGADYVGNGSDLHLFQRLGTNWAPQSFSYASSNRTLTVNGLTNACTFAVVQTPVVPLAVTTTNGASLTFTPIAGWTHHLSR